MDSYYTAEAYEVTLTRAHGNLLDPHNWAQIPRTHYHIRPKTPLEKLRRAVAFHTKDTPKWNTSDPS